MLMTMIVVEGDDTQALQHTISSLCSLNSVGKFASCCASYNNGASITLEDTPARSCFIKSFKSTAGSILTSLFVFCFSFSVLSFSFIFPLSGIFNPENFLF